MGFRADFSGDFLYLLVFCCIIGIVTTVIHVRNSAGGDTRIRFYYVLSFAMRKDIIKVHTNIQDYFLSNEEFN